MLATTLPLLHFISVSCRRPSNVKINTITIGMTNMLLYNTRYPHASEDDMPFLINKDNVGTNTCPVHTLSNNVTPTPTISPPATRLQCPNPDLIMR